MLCEECLPLKIIFKNISLSLCMHYFLLPAIALMRVLIAEKALNTYNILRNIRCPTCSQPHKPVVASCLVRNFSSCTGHSCSWNAHLTLGWQQTRSAPVEITVNATGYWRAIITLSGQLGTENCGKRLKKNMQTLWVTQQHGRNPVRGTRRKVSVPVSSVGIYAEEAEEGRMHPAG